MRPQTPTNAVTIDGENIVFIRAGRMNAALRQTVIGGAWKTIPGNRPGGNMGDYNRELWKANIVAVEGPLFEGFKCPLSDSDLDELPRELNELMTKALGEIDRINADPNE